MTDPAERFIEAAVRPLGDNAELQMMAARELREAIVTNELPAGCDTLAQAAENLERGRLANRWKFVLYAVTAVVAIIVSIPVVLEYTRYRLASYALFAMGDSAVVALPGLPFKKDAESRVPDLLGNFTPAERLLLFGDLSKLSEPERFEALWDSDPTNPAYFAEYARDIAGWRPLPVDFLATAEQIDPQNGWFYSLAAAHQAEDAIDRRSLRRKGGSRPKYTVKNPAQLNEAIRLLELAARMPRYESYEEEMFLRRVEILPAGDDVMERQFADAYLHMVPPKSRWIHPAIAWAVAAKAEELGRTGDSAAFLKLVDSWETFVARSIRNSVTSPHEVIGPVGTLRLTTRDLAETARLLNLSNLENRFARLEGEMESRKDAAHSRSERSEVLNHAGYPESAGVLWARSRTESPPPLTLTDLRPGWMAKRVFYERVAAVVVAVVMLLGVILSVAFKTMRGVQARRLSASLVDVLRPADHAWILLGGVGVPIAISLAIGAFERDSSGERIVLHAALLAGLMLVLPVVLAGRRLGKRLGCLDWDKRTVPELVALGVAVAISLAGVFAAIDPPNLILLCLAALAVAMIAVPYLILPISVLSGPRHVVVRWLAYCRALVPAYAAGVLAMALSVPIFHAREKHWTRLNVLTRIEPGVPAMSRYEFRVAEQLRKELLETLHTP